MISDSGLLSLMALHAPPPPSLLSVVTVQLPWHCSPPQFRSAACAHCGSKCSIEWQLMWCARCRTYKSHKVYFQSLYSLFCTRFKSGNFFFFLHCTQIIQSIESYKINYTLYGTLTAGSRFFLSAATTSRHWTINLYKCDLFTCHCWLRA